MRFSLRKVNCLARSRKRRSSRRAKLLAVGVAWPTDGGQTADVLLCDSIQAQNGPLGHFLDLINGLL